MFAIFTVRLALRSNLYNAKIRFETNKMIPGSAVDAQLADCTKLVETLALIMVQFRSANNLQNTLRYIVIDDIHVRLWIKILRPAPHLVKRP